MRGIGLVRRRLVVSTQRPGPSLDRVDQAGEDDPVAGRKSAIATARPTGRLTVIVTLATLAALIVGGCVSSASFPSPTVPPPGLPTVVPLTSVPPSISAILDSWPKVGMACGEPQVGMREGPGEPQWSCQGTLRGVRINIAFSADAAGLADMTAQVPAATKAQTAVGVFDDLMAATPAFSSAMPSIREWIKGWNGSQGLVSTQIPSVRLSIESDAIWITLSMARVPRFGSPTPGGSD